VKKRATPKGTLVRAARRLSALLKTPKTKRGMAAAVSDLALSQWFVSGWLSREMKAGRVIEVHQRVRGQKLYVLATTQVEPPKVDTIYPAWLCPQEVPQYASRRYCANLDPFDPEKQQQESESEHDEEGTCTADR
jgi:hypothetical protein